jgi:hypothetical protein
VGFFNSGFYNNVRNFVTFNKRGHKKCIKELQPLKALCPYKIILNERLTLNLNGYITQFLLITAKKGTLPTSIVNTKIDNFTKLRVVMLWKAVIINPEIILPSYRKCANIQISIKITKLYRQNVNIRQKLQNLHDVRILAGILRV